MPFLRLISQAHKSYSKKSDVPTKDISQDTKRLSTWLVSLIEVMKSDSTRLLVLVEL